MIKQPNDRNLFDHFIDCCKALGVSGIKDALNKLITVDYIISNEDRHWNNFGLVRNAETLQWLGLAPVYDSGTSLWYNTQRVGSPVGCKPFRKLHAEQLKLVDDFSWFGSKLLGGLDEEMMKILSHSEYTDERRQSALVSAAMERCGQIEKLID